MITVDKEKGTVSLEVSIEDVKKEIQEAKVPISLSDKECLNIISKTLKSFEKGDEPAALLGVQGMIKFHIYAEGVKNTRASKLTQIASRVNRGKRLQRG